jgi:hypothetical protein
MLDFSRVRNKEITMNDLVAGLTPRDLRGLTDEMIDAQLKLIADCVDADITFEPEDPGANDTFASNPDEVNLAWTLGHVIVHVTASSEESAALATELARGVEYHGRSRSEIPWQTVTTMAQCRERLEESRRMRHASLAMWPDQPYLDNMYEPRAGADKINAIARFASGLSHDNSHLGQIEEIVRQTKAAQS